MEKSKEELTSWLLNECDIPAEELEGTVNCLLDMTEEGTTILENYIITGKLADYGEFDVAFMRENFPGVVDVALITCYDGLFVKGGLNAYIRALREQTTEE